MESRRLKESAFLLLSIFALSMGVAYGALLVLPDFVYYSASLHTFLEVLNVSICLSMVIILIRLKGFLIQYFPKLFWLSCAFLLMAVLGIFHIASDGTNNSVWFDCLSLFFGGLCFSLVWFPALRYERINKPVLLILLIVAIIFCGYFVWDHDFAPLMVERNHLTYFPMVVSIIAAVCFLTSALYYVERYVEAYRVASLFIAVACVIYSAACLAFTMSIYGDIGWWVTHLIRNAANLVLYFLIISIFSKLSETHIVLEHESMKAKSELEKALNEQDKDLEAKHKELLQQQKHDAIEQLASGLAHDFNAYLDGIIQRIYNLQDQFPQTEIINITSDVLNLARQGRSRTNMLLTYAREEKVEYEQFKLDSLMFELEQILNMVEEDRKFTYEFLNEEKGIDVYADHRKLLQLLLNIIQNAKDSMPNGGKIIIDAYSTFDRHNVNKKWGVVKIIDEGEGLSEESIERLFEPYYTTKAGDKNTGLGLSVAQGLIKEFYGKLDVKTKEGLGTAFTISIPKIESEDDIENLADPSVVTPKNFLANQKVLLINRDEEVLQHMQTFLKQYTDHIYVATTAQSGKLILETKDSFDYMIVDFTLPDKSGLDLIKDVEAQFSNLKIILTLNYGLKLNSEYLNEHPSVTAITKPFPFNELLIHLAILNGSISPDQRHLITR